MHSLHWQQQTFRLLFFFHGHKKKLVHFSKPYVRIFRSYDGNGVYTLCMYMVVLCVLLIKIPRCNRFKTGQFPIQIGCVRCFFFHFVFTMAYTHRHSVRLQFCAHLNANAHFEWGKKTHTYTHTYVHMCNLLLPIQVWVCVCAQPIQSVAIECLAIRIPLHWSACFFLPSLSF